jgi:glycerate dehydrogenase
VLIVNKTPVRREALLQLPRLKFISVSATGFDCVDIEAAGLRGVPVSKVPVYGTDSACSRRPS